MLQDETHVNLNALDSLVLDYAVAENLLEYPHHSNNQNQNRNHNESQCSSPLASSSSSFSSVSSENSVNKKKEVRDKILRIRKLTEQGSIEEVLALLSSHAPSLLQDQRLLFRLHKQNFIELLRRGGSEGRDLAIKCCRTSLGPCALNAYPEAYEEFKKVLLAFIYEKDDKASPVAEEWAEKRRLELAALLTSTLKANLQAYDPCFVQTLKYLLGIHNEYCYHEAFTSNISDVNRKLLCEERDPPALLRESLYQAPQFDEVDVQALAHAVGLQRQGAIDSLRYTNGDLFAAFQNELSRMKLNLPMADELVYEYCVYRGLVQGEMKMQDNMAKKLVPAVVENGGHPDVNIEPDVEMNDFADKAPESSSKQNIYNEMRSLDGTSYIGEICSTSGSDTKIEFEKLCLWMEKEMSCHPRWKFRYSGCTSEKRAEIDCNKERISAHMPQVDAKKYESCDFQIILLIRQLVLKGMVEKAVHVINELYPHFFKQNPAIFFQLKQVEFLRFVEKGSYMEALKVARSDLGPVASQTPTLFKLLKESLLILASPKESILVQCVSLPALATAVQVALGATIGIEEPLLIKIMGGTLYTHTEWFKLQMCADKFEKLLSIGDLKEVEEGVFTVKTSRSKQDTLSGTTSQETNSSCNFQPSDGSSQLIQASGDIRFNETAVLQVMEFLALPRSDAIHLLMQYEGSVDAVFQQLIS